MESYEGFKVPELKNLLKERSLPTSGRKSELVKRLCDNDEAVNNSADAKASEDKEQPAANDTVVDEPVGDTAEPEQDAKDAENVGVSKDCTDDANGDAEELEKAGDDALAAAPSGSGPSGPADDEPEKQVEENKEYNANEAPQTELDKMDEAEQGNQASGEVQEQDKQEKNDIDDEVERAKEEVDDGPVQEEAAVNGDTNGQSAEPSAEKPAESAEPPAAKAASPDNVSDDSLSLDEDEPEEEQSPKRSPAATQTDPKVAPGEPSAEAPSSQRKPIVFPSESPAPAADAEGKRSGDPGSAEGLQDAGMARTRSGSAGEAPGGSKRKHAAIVFTDPAMPVERQASAKREKVELVVPESTDESTALRIDGLKRPLRESELKDILSETGKVEGFWINSYKTHCYVVYSSIEEARATFKAVDGRKWPPKCKSVMHPVFVSAEEAQGMIDSQGAASLKRVPLAEVGGIRGSAEDRSNQGEAEENGEAKAMEVDEPVPGGSAPKVIDLTAPQRPPRQDPSLIAVGGSAPEVGPSQLFKLTKTAPMLYWLPLTDSQVERLRSVDEAKRMQSEQKKQEESEARSKGDAGGEAGGAAEAEAETGSPEGKVANTGEEEKSDEKQAGSQEDEEMKGNEDPAEEEAVKRTEADQVDSQVEAKAASADEDDTKMAED